MSDAELKQAIAELKEVVRCRCDEAYRDRGLKDPHCECDSAEAVKVVARGIKDLTAKMARAEWLLTDAAVQLEEGKIKTRRNRAGLIWQFLGEIKGESHDPL